MFLPELVTEECCICSFKSRDSHTKPFHCPTWLCMCWASLAVKYVGVSKSIMAFPFSFSYFSLYFTWGSKQKCQVNCCGKSGFNQFAKTGSQYGYLSLFLLVKYIYNTYKAAKSFSLSEKIFYEKHFLHKRTWLDKDRYNILSLFFFGSIFEGCCVLLPCLELRLCSTYVTLQFRRLLVMKLLWCVSNHMVVTLTLLKFLLVAVLQGNVPVKSDVRKRV